MVVELGLFVLQIGLAALAGYLLNRKNKALVQDDKPTTLATRGSFFPRLIGRRRIGFVFAAAGNRQKTKEPAPGGKGSIGGLLNPKVDVYREDGWHLLCVGPATCLWSVEQNGEIIFAGPITNESHPSGSTIDLGNEGAFKIYWGENGVAAGQPVNTPLNDTLIGLDNPSSWPYACYIYWVQKRMGPSPNWPQITYVLETRPQSTILTQSDGYVAPTQVLGTDTFTVSLVTNGVKGVAKITVLGDASALKPKQQIELSGNTGLGVDTDFTLMKVVVLPLGSFTELFTNETISGATNDGTVTGYDSQKDDGINPAHAIAELLFEPWPYGIAQPQSGEDNTVDLESLEALGVTLETEGIKGSWIAPDGQDLQGLLAGIHQDMGIFWPINFRTGLLEFVAIRKPTGTIHHISADMQTVPSEIEVFHGEQPTSRLVFSFPDEENQFRDMTIAVDEDGQGARYQYFRQRVVQIVSTHLFNVASLIANRRSLEELSAGFGDFKISSNRASRVLLPGEAITADGFNEVLRVTKVKTDPESGEVEVNVMPDFYGAALSDFIVDRGNTGSGGVPVEKDVGFDIIEVPEILTGANGPQTIIVPRIRAHTSILGSNIYISPDDTTYSFEGNDGTIMSGGTLDAELSANDEMEIDLGPLFTAEGPDISSVLDLSADTAAWRGGRQLVAFVNASGDQEIAFLQRIVNISGDTYQMRGLIRARYDTRMVTHPSGTRAFILEDTDGLPIQDSVILQPSTIVYAKSSPTGVGSVPIATVTPESLTLYGKGLRPITPTNIRLDLDSGVSGSGRTRWTDFFYKITGIGSEDDLIFTWAYSTPQLPGTGAGQQGAGTPVVDPLPEGPFIVEVFDGVTLKRSETVASASFIYTETDRLADFSASEPASFTLKVTQLRGGYQSDVAEQLFTKE